MLQQIREHPLSKASRERITHTRNKKYGVQKYYKACTFLGKRQNSGNLKERYYTCE